MQRMDRVACVAVALGLLGACATNQDSGQTNWSDEDRSPAAAGPELAKTPDFKYDVLFTDPTCDNYKYSPAQKSIKSGKTLEQKPKDVYCKSSDIDKSGKRESSPQNRLIQWINNPETSEIWFTYLSVRNKTVLTAMCEAFKKGHLKKVTFAMSSTEDSSRAEELVKCGNGKVKLHKRGNEGGIGYAHNKIFMVNPQNAEHMKASDKLTHIAFSSGNMSTGPVLHHENWHFISVRGTTHFAQMHWCVLDAEFGETYSHDRAKYSGRIAECRQQLKQKFPEESDIHAFFIPGDGNGGENARAASTLVRGSDGFPGIEGSKSIFMGTHRFSYGRMITALRNGVQKGTLQDLRILVDDDTYWTGITGQKTSDIFPEEYQNIKQLVDGGKGKVAVKFMETNHQEHQLHHSKFLIFDDGNGKLAFWAGAGNLTTAAFNDNWENFYYVSIPTIAQAMRNHYLQSWDRTGKPWDNMAKDWQGQGTEPDDMPSKDVLP